MDKKESTSGDSNATSGAEELKVLREHKEKLEKELQNYRAKAKELEEKSLREKEDYKTIAELKAKEVEELKASNESLLKTFKDSKIEEKIKTEFLSKSGKPEYVEDVLKLIDKGKVTIDPTSGAVVGVESVFNGFYEKYKGTGFFKTGQLGVNHSAPISGTPKEDLSKLTQKQKMERLRELHKKN